MRDEMLNSYMKQTQATGGLPETPVSCPQWSSDAGLAAHEVKFLSRSPQEEAASLKRRVIVDFAQKYACGLWAVYTPGSSREAEDASCAYVCFRFTTQVSQYCVRAQIVAYYYSLMSLLDEVPSIRQSHFIIGQASNPSDALDSEVDHCPDPR